MNITWDEVCSKFRHSLEGETYNRLQEWFVSKETILDYYEKVEEEGALPDLRGKMVLAGPNQFHKLHLKINEISAYLKMPAPECYIYDSYHYVCDSEGIRLPRLEISNRIVQDFSDSELTHVIAKELYHIKNGHVKTEVMADKILGLYRMIPKIPGISLANNFGGGYAFEAAGFHFRSLAFRWFKYACFSAENFAVSYTGKIHNSIRATLLCIFNDPNLVENTNIRDWLHQISYIEACIGPSATMEVINEVIPYGPYRILNMLRFSLSDDGLALYGQLSSST